MRVTDRMIVNHTLSNIQQGRKRLGIAQTRVATGRNLLRSSDGPADVERAMTLASELRMAQKQSTNLHITRDWLNGTDRALDDFSNLMVEARNLGLRAMNDTNSEMERTAMGTQVGELLKNALAIANTQQAGNYLFSGHQVKTEPFAIQDNAVIYRGDNSTINHIVELGQTMPINVTGVAGRSGGLFNALTNLQNLRENMLANDKGGVEAFLGNTTAIMEDIATAQNTTGVRIQRVDHTLERMQQRETDLKHLYSQLVDADMAEVIAELMAEERAYEMSLATTARILPRSLLDFLR
jgi:flagellar hook-associated protein 3 FlgL